MNDKSSLKDNKEYEANRIQIKDYEDFFNQNKLRIIPSSNPTAHIKNLSNPRFLGSYHLKQANDSKYRTFNALMKGDLEIKYAKALRGAILNPVTIALIIIAVVFNILWFFLL